MLTFDSIISYKGAINTPSLCQVQIYSYPYGPPEATQLVIIHEIPNNPGTSVTNASEYIAAELVKTQLVRPHDLFVEHYPPGKSDFEHEDTYDVITYSWAGNVARSPKWKRIKNEEFDKLINIYKLPIDDGIEDLL